MKTLLVIDVQNDFLPTGSLPVPEGDRVIAAINALMPGYDLVIATQDWHPPTHASFAANHPGKSPGDMINLAGLPQILWPTHCVQGTPGSAFAPGLDIARFTHIVQKGVDPEIDSYSGFFDNGHKRDTGLAALLRSRDVTAVDVVGLATDYCVKATALDALREGFAVRVLAGACRGVNLRPGDVDHALADLRAAGAEVLP